MTDDRKKRWLEGTYAKAVKKGPERRARFDTTSGIPAEPVYTNGDVKHLRSAFDTPRSSSPSETATAGKKDGETQLLRGFESYLTHKFIVLSRDPVIAGGSQVTIFFQGKSDAVFHAWVYDRGGGANRYELRGFKKANVPKDERDRMAVRYRRSQTSTIPCQLTSAHS